MTRGRMGRSKSKGNLKIHGEWIAHRDTVLVLRDKPKRRWSAVLMRTWTK